ncbi:MAG: hypothetical protein AAF039_03735 [Bacteroidota bacterium]
MLVNRKNKLLVLGFALMVLISYRLAIRNTLSTYGTYVENKKGKERVGNIPKQLALLTQKERALDKKLRELNLEDSSNQSNLLKFLNRQAQLNAVKIIAFNAPHSVKKENRTTETYIFDLEGNYTDILKIINALENSGSFGAVVHLQIEKLKNYRSKKTYLQAKVFLEQVK